MSLQNLLKIGQLKEHPASAPEIQQLLAAAQRSVADARVHEVSPETRLDAAYKAIMQAALAAMMAHGYRPDTNRPGHHMTVVQALGLTIDLAASRVTVLDTLRRKRNIADYTGEDIDDGSADSCADEASRLVEDVRAWLRANRPKLIAK